MFKNYLLSAFRSIKRDHYYAAINLSGLAIGITCCLILGLYLINEFNYDKHHQLLERIQRVAFSSAGPDGEITSHETSLFLGPMLASNFSEVETYVRFQNASRNPLLFRAQEKALYWDSVYFADANVFEIFSHNVIAGNPQSALEAPSSIAISETFAQAYFGDDSPIGSILSDGSESYRVTLVFEDLPETSHLSYDALLPFAAYNATEMDSFNLGDLFRIGTSTYLVMPESYDPSAFSTIADSFWEQYMAPVAEQSPFLGRWNFYLEPLADLHLYSTTSLGDSLPNIFYLYVLVALGLLMVTLVVINYINLTTARFTTRNTEIGVRKAVGASKHNIIFQFLGESVLLALMALPLSLLLTEILLRTTYLANLFDVQIAVGDLFTLPMLAGSVLLTLLLGLISGIYPAFFLSSIEVRTLLAGNRVSGKGSRSIRQWLVLVQFTISIGVIISTVIMLSQINYIESRSLGFDEENKIVLDLSEEELQNRLSRLKNAMDDSPDIQGVTAVSDLPGRGTRSMSYLGSDGVQHTFNYSFIDESFIDLMGIQLLAGNAFTSRSMAQNLVIVNETAVQAMGWGNPQAAIGQTIEQLVPGQNTSFQVSGVISDYHLEGLEDEIAPLALLPDPAGSRAMYMVLDVAETDRGRAIDQIQKVWRQVNPDFPFVSEFLDESLDRLYTPYRRQLNLVSITAWVCILISLLGLFGLSAYTLDQRKQELGIRKILGASAWQISVLLTRSVLRLIVWAGVLASPVSFFLMRGWLDQFAYRMDITLSTFFIVLFGCAALVVVLIILQSWRTVRANPVNVLRYNE